jgi:ectoine hydroxylase-related dioxygenase (phytanoyl-CoA dioxygenase family)
VPRLRLDENNWLMKAIELLEDKGYFILEGVLTPGYIQECKQAMLEVQTAIVEAVGPDKLDRAGELGVLRLMMKFDQHFFSLLAIPELLAIIDHAVGKTSIMHLQNGFILPSLPQDKTPSLFQNVFHQDFPRYMGGYIASINVMLALDDFTEETGATWVVPGSHQNKRTPDSEYLKFAAIPTLCPAGSMIVFDSTLWHAAGHNISGRDRYAINHQFTRSFIKQQIDYVRALGEDCILRQPPRTQQLLGYYTRVVTSLNEYYLPESERLYRKNQG